jgi:hypothetical protein
MTPCKQRKLILAKNTIKNRITKITTRQEESPEKKTRKHKNTKIKLQKKQNLHFPQLIFLVFLVAVLRSFCFFLFCVCFFLDFGFLVCFLVCSGFFSLNPYILCAAGLINIVCDFLYVKLPEVTSTVKSAPICAHQKYDKFP